MEAPKPEVLLAVGVLQRWARVVLSKRLMKQAKKDCSVFLRLVHRLNVYFTVQTYRQSIRNQSQLSKVLATNNNNNSRGIASTVASAAITAAAVKTRIRMNSSWREYFYNTLAMFAVSLSAAAFFLEGGWIVSAVSAVCAFLGPAAALQQQRLTDLKNLRILQNELRGQVNAFQHENNQLRQENAKLAQSAKRLEEVQADLTTLSKLQGQSTKTLLQQIQEFRKIQDKIQESLEAKVIQNLIDVVIRSDHDKDFIIDKNEVDGLLTRLKNMEGVDFSEENFKKAIAAAGYDVDTVLAQKGGFDLSAVISVVKNLLDDHVPDDENIFKINTQKLLPRNLQMNII